MGGGGQQFSAPRHTDQRAPLHQDYDHPPLYPVFFLNILDKSKNMYLPVGVVELQILQSNRNQTLSGQFTTIRTKLEDYLGLSSQFRTKHETELINLKRTVFEPNRQTFN